MNSAVLLPLIIIIVGVKCAVNFSSDQSYPRRYPIAPNVQVFANDSSYPTHLNVSRNTTIQPNKRRNLAIESRQRPDSSRYDTDGYGNSGIDGSENNNNIRPSRNRNSNQPKCDCVPYYQCANGKIVDDGTGIIDPRKKAPPKAEIPLVSPK